MFVFCCYCLGGGFVFGEHTGGGVSSEWVM